MHARLGAHSRAHPPDVVTFQLSRRNTFAREHSLAQALSMLWTPVELEYDVFVICVPVRKHSCLLLRLCILLQGEPVSWQSVISMLMYHPHKDQSQEDIHAIGCTACSCISKDWHLGCGLLHAQLLVLFLFLLHLFQPEELLALQLIQLALQQTQMAVVFSMLAGRQVTNDLKSTCWWDVSVPLCSLCQVTIGSSMCVTRECTVHAHGGKPGGGRRAHLDVRDGVLQARAHHRVQRVHPPVGGLDRLVQRQEGGLQAGQLHQQLDGVHVLLAGRLQA